MFSIPFDVEKSITIETNPAEVFASVSDFGTWRHWSPWLGQEPDCPVTIEGAPGSVGHSQAWNGSVIGSGTMRLAAATPSQSLDYELTFLQPWKSKSKVSFRLAPKGTQTELTWTMRGKLPVFLFAMKKMMTAWIGGDYSRGLGMLKEYLENGSVPTKTDVKGPVDRQAYHYVGKRRSCSVSEMGPAMAEDFAELGQLLEGARLPAPQGVFSIYHNFDLVAGRCDYTSGFLYDGQPELKVDLATGQLPAHRALRVDHQGPYRHLGNAWAAAMGCARSMHKINKALPMYEVYANNPNEVPEDDLKVEVYVPVKR